ncbi:MAG: hypothetical protein NC417_13715 [Candidatus Gastranaerophilales bacterium]|nr:hypothetical protein [Candidatus Gastranaerophilales bacterium]
MLKHKIVITMATGIHGMSLTCAVSRFVASFPYSDVMTKNEYDMSLCLLYLPQDKRPIPIRGKLLEKLQTLYNRQMTAGMLCLMQFLLN